MPPPQVQCAAELVRIRSSGKRWFEVRIMPYRRLDNVIDGAVLTCVDIPAPKQLETTLRESSDT